MIDPLDYLPSWLKELEILKLARAAKGFWTKLVGWLEFPLTQIDPMNCHSAIVPLHAWSRRVDRFPGEDEQLWRQRIKDAHANRKDAGFTKGLSTILTRFGVSNFTIKERDPAMEADMVMVEIPDGDLTANSEIIQKVLQDYGLTCRRYVLSSNDQVTNSINLSLIGNNHATDKVSLL